MPNKTSATLVRSCRMFPTAYVPWNRNNNCNRNVSGIYWTKSNPWSNKKPTTGNNKKSKKLVWKTSKISGPLVHRILTRHRLRLPKWPSVCRRPITECRNRIGLFRKCASNRMNVRPIAMPWKAVPMFWKPKSRPSIPRKIEFKRRPRTAKMNSPNWKPWSPPWRRRCRRWRPGFRNWKLIKRITKNKPRLVSRNCKAFAPPLRKPRVVWTARATRPNFWPNWSKTWRVTPNRCDTCGITRIGPAPPLFLEISCM